VACDPYAHHWPRAIALPSGVYDHVDVENAYCMTNPIHKKVLLSSVCQPFGEKYGDSFTTTHDAAHQIIWGQGIFQIYGTNNQWGIDFVAQNLQTPTTTLHYPTMEQFIEEIKKGYDYIGISFVHSTFHKMVPMTEAIRKYAPSSKIILGGHGTTLGDRLSAYADYICQGEGVVYMRELLGEPLDRPIEQPIIVEWQSFFSLPMLPIRGYYAHIFAGLGCPNGCEFCCTSAFFKRKHIKLLPDGASVVRAIEKIRERLPNTVDFWISDEDFLLNPQRGRQFLEAMRASNLPPLSLGIFSSVRAISQYQASELVEMGVERLWVGYEAKGAEYDKMKGKSYRELFSELHHHGITVLASMIIGYDYQTKEFDEFMSLRPSVTQYLILGGPIGTPLFEKNFAEGRVFPEYLSDFRKWDGYYVTHSRPNISAEELYQLVRFLPKEEFRRLGPSIFRFTEDWVTGYENLKDHPSPRVRAKTQKYLRDSLLVRPFLLAGKEYLPVSLHGWVDSLYERLVKAAGEPNLTERLIATTAPALLRYASFRLKRDIERQPKFIRREFPERGDYWRENAVDLWIHRAIEQFREMLNPSVGQITD
jgi:hypothetical protein